MAIRKTFLIGMTCVYLSALSVPTQVAAQDALIGGLAGGVIGGMIAGSMARQNAYGGGYYRRSQATRYYHHSRVARDHAPASQAKSGSGTAATINASDPFAKPTAPPTTSVGSR